jgi:aspartyl-tRNA(Asn)/glutamyl-tRNA(Gln) amidotransferase subunit A
MDELRRAGAEPSPFAGIPVSVKDLFDIRGQVTRAGSRALEGPPASGDAAAVARWRQAGLVLLGRTNMTEFAYSGLGINPHYGTPANPWDRAHRRIPGGSSSGAAVSVSDEMAHGALGTDTGGSCRIPAALCGLVGFKPTQSRIPREGVVPLSTTLDAVGVLGRTVECCAVLEAILAGETPAPPRPLSRAPRLAVPRNYLFADVEAGVDATFTGAVERCRDAGATVTEITIPELDELPEMNAGGGFASAEAYAWHHELIARRHADYDPRVLVRIRRGAEQSARDLVVLHQHRRAMIERVRGRLDGFDAFICPTVPMVAPPIEAFGDDAEYARVNLLMLRNPTVVNIVDGCAVSVPIHVAGDAPVGLMVAGLAGEDAGVLRIAAWIEEHTCPS